MSKVAACEQITACVDCCKFGGGYENINNLYWFVCHQELVKKVFILIPGNYQFDSSWNVYDWDGDPRTEIPNNRCRLRNQAG